MCQQGGERCRTKNLLCTGLCERIHLVSAACEGDMHFRGGFCFLPCFGIARFPAPVALSFASVLRNWCFGVFSRSWMTVLSPASLLRSHACFDRLRRAFALVLGDRSLLVKVTCSCFSLAFYHLIRFSSSFFFFLVLFLVFGITDRWC